MKLKNLFLRLALLAPLLVNGLAHGASPEPKDPFDRLDGVGPTRVNVRVIDWAGNIELQISPMNQVKSLGFKIDRETDKNRPVLVIEYQWKHVPYRQIRRALLTTPLKEGFKVYYDASYGDRDRYILTNHIPSQKGLVAFTPGPEPTQIWPDHHENLHAGKEPQVQSAQQGMNEDRPSSGFTPFSTESQPKPRAPAKDVQAERPQRYQSDGKARPGVQLQQGQLEPGEGTTRRRRQPVEFEPSEDVSQGFDF